MLEVKFRAYRDDVLRTIQLISKNSNHYLGVIYESEFCAAFMEYAKSISLITEKVHGKI